MGKLRQGVMSLEWCGEDKEWGIARGRAVWSGQAEWSGEDCYCAMKVNGCREGPPNLCILCLKGFGEG